MEEKERNETAGTWRNEPLENLAFCYAFSDVGEFKLLKDFAG